MRKLKFDRRCIASLDEPLNVGDIIEVTDTEGMKSNIMVCVDEDNSSDCRFCWLSPSGKSGCKEMIYAPFTNDMHVSPCSAALLNDGKKYTYMHCIYYKNMDSLLEDL